MVPFPVVLYCHTKTRFQSQWCATFTQRNGASPCWAILSHRHGTCPCSVLLSHKDTVLVPGVLHCHTKTRYLSLRCSTVTQRHDASPCGVLPHTTLRGTGGHVFDPGPRHTKVVKNGTSCSSLGTQTYGVELGLVDPVSG